MRQFFGPYLVTVGVGLVVLAWAPAWEEWSAGLATPLDFPGMIDRARVWNDRDGQLAWEFLWTVARMFTLRQEDGVAKLLRGQTVVHRIELPKT